MNEEKILEKREKHIPLYVLFDGRKTYMMGVELASNSYPEEVFKVDMRPILQEEMYKMEVDLLNRTLRTIRMTDGVMCEAKRLIHPCRFKVWGKEIKISPQGKMSPEAIAAEMDYWKGLENLSREGNFQAMSTWMLPGGRQLEKISPRGFHFRDLSILGWRGSVVRSPVRGNMSFALLWDCKGGGKKRPSGYWEPPDCPQMLLNLFEKLPKSDLGRGKSVPLFPGRTDGPHVSQREGGYLITPGA